MKHPAPDAVSSTAHSCIANGYKRSGWLPQYTSNPKWRYRRPLKHAGHRSLRKSREATLYRLPFAKLLEGISGKSRNQWSAHSRSDSTVSGHVAAGRPARAHPDKQTSPGRCFLIVACYTLSYSNDPNLFSKNVLTNDSHWKTLNGPTDYILRNLNKPPYKHIENKTIEQSMDLKARDLAEKGAIPPQQKRETPFHSLSEGSATGLASGTPQD